MSGPSPAGWFPDPYGTPGLLRWWDGGQWTQATVPAQPQPQPQPAQFQPAQPPQFQPAQPAQTQPGYGPPGQPPAPTPPPQRNDALPWLIGGGAGLVVIVLVVVAAVIGLRGTGGDDKKSPQPAPPAPTRAAQGGPSSDAGGGQAATRSTVIGRVTDSKIGISYARLGAPWTPADSSWFSPRLFSAGQVSVVQAPFEQYVSFNATSLSGPLRPTESAGYTGPGDLAVPARKAMQRILHEHFNLAGGRRTISSGAYPVTGGRAWLERFRLDFADAKARNWKFTADTVAILVIDLGGRRLGLLWVSVPDTFPHQGDIDQVLKSVKVR